MSRSQILAVLLVTCMGSVGAAAAAGNVNFVGGGRALSDQSLWSPNEDQGAAGLSVNFGPEAWPLSIATGGYASYIENDVDVVDPNGAPAIGEFRTGMIEVSLGLQKTFEFEGRTRLYLAGGASGVAVAAEVEAGDETYDDNERAFGAFLEGGIFWRLGSRFNLGLQARGLLGTDVDLDFTGLIQAEGNVDYIQGGLILGWGWPGD